MIHIDIETLPLKALAHIGASTYPVGAVCRAELTYNDSLTAVAFESDCDDCRTRLNIGASKDKGSDGKPYGVKAAPVYTPGPVLESDKKED